MKLENEHMKRENASLRDANHQAQVLLDEFKEKLTFSQGNCFNSREAVELKLPM